MKKVNEDLIRKLAYEERLGLYRLAQKKEIEQDEVLGSLMMIEDLTNVNLTSTGFDAQSMSIVGVDNCCNYFKSLCQQYHDLIKNSQDGEFNAHQQRMDIAIGSKYQQVKPRIIDIGLYDSARIVDKTISDNYAELVNRSMNGNDDKKVYQYAAINTFADVYYQIRDLVEGKSYYDGQFMTENRELPIEYEKQSQYLLQSFMERANVSSVEAARNQLVTTLNEGISSLKSIVFGDTVKSENDVSTIQNENEYGEYYSEYEDSDSNNPFRHK